MKKLISIIITVLVFITCDMENNSSMDSIINPGDTPDNPIARTENHQLTSAAWFALLNEIESEGKYVDLDLSACTAGSHSSGGGLWNDGTFNADPVSGVKTGKGKIVSLILPEAATSIAEGRVTGISGGLPTHEHTFQYFTALKNVTGINVTTIGGWAFTSLGWPAGMSSSKPHGCLTNIYFPKVENIGEEAFSGCYNLTNTNIPKVKTIGDQAFTHCSLQTLFIPEVTDIGVQAFGWTKPTKITLGTTAPWVDRYMFALTWNPRTITVMVPQGATGYGTIPNDYIGGDISKNWGNAFRGMGWNPSKAGDNAGEGSRYDAEGYGPTSYIDTTLILRIEYIP